MGCGDWITAERTTVCPWPPMLMVCRRGPSDTARPMKRNLTDPIGLISCRRRCLRCIPVRTVGCYTGCQLLLLLLWLIADADDVRLALFPARNQPPQHLRSVTSQTSASARGRGLINKSWKPLLFRTMGGALCNHYLSSRVVCIRGAAKSTLTKTAISRKRLRLNVSL